MRPRLLLAAAPLLLGACAQTALTWQSEQPFEPLPADAAVRLYVRASAPERLRAVLLQHGAEEVAAFPDGERVAEIAARDAGWISWEALLDDVTARARALGADQAMATGGTRAGAAEGVVYFQLLRSREAP